MNKTVKKISLILAVMLMVAMLMTTAMAVTFHQGVSWTIPGANQRSREHSWTAKASAIEGKVYIDTKANTVQTGAEDTFFKVALNESGAACSQVKCNLGYLSRRDIAIAITGGNTYATYSWRVDPTLNTDIVDGLTNIYNR